MTNPHNKKHNEKVKEFIQSVNTSQTTDSYTILKKSVELATINGKFEDRLFTKILKSALLASNCSTLDLTTNPNFKEIIGAEHTLDAKIDNLSKSIKNYQLSKFQFVTQTLGAVSLIAIFAYHLTHPYQPWDFSSGIVLDMHDMLGIPLSDVRPLLVQAYKYIDIIGMVLSCFLGYNGIALFKNQDIKPPHMKKFDEVIEAAYNLKKIMPENKELIKRIEDIKEHGNTEKTFKKAQQDQKMIKKTTERTETNVRLTDSSIANNGTHVINISSSHRDNVTQRKAVSSQRTITI